MGLSVQERNVNLPIGVRSKHARHSLSMFQLGARSYEIVDRYLSAKRQFFLIIKIIHNFLAAKITCKAYARIYFQPKVQRNNSDKSRFFTTYF